MAVKSKSISTQKATCTGMQITEGKWIKRENTAEEERWFQKFRRCPIKWRHKCAEEKARRTFLWKWVTSQKDNSFLSNLLDDRLIGKQLILLGDSFTHQVYEAIVCGLIADGANFTKFLSSKFSFTWGHHDKQLQLTQQSKQLQKQPQQQTHFTVEFGFTSHFIAAGGGEKAPELDMSKLSNKTMTLMRNRGLTHLVMNTGHWWETIDVADEERTTLYRNSIRLTLDTLHSVYTKRPYNDEKSKRKVPKLFYQSTPFRHFVGGEWDEGGTCPFTEPQFDTDDVGKYVSYAKVKKFNSIACQESQRFNNKTKGEETKHMPYIEYLDSSPILQSRADAHVEDNDCTHYCLPSVLTVWARHLLYLVSNK